MHGSEMKSLSDFHVVVGRGRRTRTRTRTRTHDLWFRIDKEASRDSAGIFHNTAFLCLEVQSDCRAIYVEKNEDLRLTKSCILNW